MIRRIATLAAMVSIMIAPLLFAETKTFQSTWKASDTEPADLTGKKVVALILSQNRAARAAAEDLLADALTSGGAQGIAGYTLVEQSDLTDRDKVKSLLQAAGVDGAVVMRPVLAGGRHPEPELMQKDPQYKRFMGFSSEPAPYGEKKVPFYVEVLVYSIHQDRLIWSGKSATKASNIDELIQNMAKGTAQEMTKDGLIKKK